VALARRISGVKNRRHQRIICAASGSRGAAMASGIQRYGGAAAAKTKIGAYQHRANPARRIRMA